MAMIKVDERLHAMATTSVDSLDATRKSEKNRMLAEESGVFRDANATPARPRQILQIHDSILIECPRDMAERISTMLVETMEQIYPDLGVRLQVDVRTGDNWGEV